MPEHEFEVWQDKGDAVWRDWCAERHAIDPVLTTARELRLAAEMVDSWKAGNANVSGVYNDMIAACRLAIRKHWPPP